MPPLTARDRLVDLIDNGNLSNRDRTTAIVQLAKLDDPNAATTTRLPEYSLAPGTLIVEPEQGGMSYRIMVRTTRGIEHKCDSLTPEQAAGLAVCALLQIDPYAEPEPEPTE